MTLRTKKSLANYYIIDKLVNAIVEHNRHDKYNPYNNILLGYISSDQKFKEFKTDIKLMSSDWTFRVYNRKKWEKLMELGQNEFSNFPDDFKALIIDQYQKFSRLLKNIKLPHQKRFLKEPIPLLLLELKKNVFEIENDSTIIRKKLSEIYLKTKEDTIFIKELIPDNFEKKDWNDIRIKIVKTLFSNLNIKDLTFEELAKSSEPIFNHIINEKANEIQKKKNYLDINNQMI